MMENGTITELRTWYADAANAVLQGDCSRRDMLRGTSNTYDSCGFRPLIGDCGDGISLYGIVKKGPEGQNPTIVLSTGLGKIVRIAEEAMRVA